MKKFSKRFLTMLLAAAMVFSLSGIMVFAAEADDETTVSEEEAEGTDDAAVVSEDVAATEAACDTCTVVEDETCDTCCSMAENDCGTCEGDAALVDNTDYGIQTLALTPDNWQASGYQPYHDLSHGKIAIEGAADGDVVNIDVGETLTLTVSPGAHVQYTGCGLGSTCAADFCGSSCWVEGKGCSCASSPALRLTAVTINQSQTSVVGVSESCDYSALSTAGEMCNDTIKLTGRRDGEVNITVSAALYDWESTEISFTVVVGEGDDSESVSCLDYEAWTTVDDDDAYTQRMHFEFSFADTLTCSDKDVLTQQLAEAQFMVGTTVLGDGGSGGTIENADLINDGKTLSFEVSGYNAQQNGEFVGSAALRSLTAEDGKYAKVNADFYVPNGVTTETTAQTVGSETEKASVSSKFVSDENTTRGMVHIAVLRNGTIVNPNENGATVTGHWHDYINLTPAEFVDSYYEALQDALGEDWEVTAKDDTMTVTYLESSEEDVIDLHVVSYLNTYYDELDTSEMESQMKAAADLLDEYGSMLENAAELQAAYRVAEVRLDQSVNYSQAEIDEAAANLEAAVNNATVPEDDSGLPYEGTISESADYVLDGIHTMTDALTIAAGADVTVDLNGYRWVLAADTGVTVNGTLTITDSSAAADGYVTRDESGKNNVSAAIMASDGGVFNLMAGGLKGITNTKSSSSAAGAAVFVGAGSVFNMYGGTISDNTANRGGAMCLYEGVFNMYGGEITNNSAATSGGGAIYAYYNTSQSTHTTEINIEGGRISDNVSSGYGGAMYLGNYSTFTMSGGEISGNTCGSTTSTTYGGGGIYASCGGVNNGTINITGGKITGNASLGGDGGGIYMTGCTASITKDALIYNNTAGRRAADIYKYGNGTVLTLEASSSGQTLYTDEHQECHEIDGWYKDVDGDRWSDTNITEKITDTEFAAERDNNISFISAHGENPTTAHAWDTENATTTWAHPYEDYYRFFATVTCSNCGEEFTGYEDVENGTYTEPTCTENGKTTYEAELILNDPNTEKLIGTFSDTLVVEEEGTALGHEWGDWEIITPATIGENGERSRTCKRCNYMETEEYAVDVEEAEDLINEADKLADDTSYTEDSRNALKEAAQDAKDVLDNPDSTQEDVDAALAALQDAIDGLKKASTNSGSGKIEIQKDPSDGNWYSYRNGEKVDYTGFGSNTYGEWYVESGKVTFTKTGILKDTNNALGDPGAWYYVIDSKVQTSFTGLGNFRNQYGWWYIKGGKVDFTHNGVDKNVNGWFYVTGGQVQFGYTGVANYKNQYGWWYVNGGKVDFNHNGVDKNKNGWWYVTGGKVQFGYTGVANYKNAYGWWYIKGGQVDFTFNGQAKNQYGTWNVVNGKVKF